MPVFCVHNKYEMIAPLRGFSNLMPRSELLLEGAAYRVSVP